MIAAIFAQLDKVDPAFLHQAVILFAGLLVGSGAAVSIYASLARRRRIIEPQPLQVAEMPAPYNPVACHGLHSEANRRLSDHDAQLRELWQLVRGEHTAIRGEMSRGFQAIDRAIGRLEGKIDALSDETK